MLAALAACLATSVAAQTPAPASVSPDERTTFVQAGRLLADPATDVVQRDKTLVIEGNQFVEVRDGLVETPVSAPASAQSQPPPTACPVRWGYPGEPLVTTPETAIAIYLAIERDFFPGAEPGEYSQVEAVDEGDWWGMYRHLAPEELPNGDLLITRGGGQLSLNIAKCDAAISDVHFTR